MLGHDPSVPEYASWSFPSWNNPSVYPGGESDSEIKLLRRTMTAEAFASGNWRGFWLFRWKDIS